MIDWLITVFVSIFILAFIALSFGAIFAFIVYVFPWMLALFGLLFIGALIFNG